MASGSLQFLEDGAWTKRMHPGWAAQAAISAATLAGARHPRAARRLRRPLRPLSPLPRRGGHDRADLSLATAGLGDDGAAATWELTNIAVKPFAICHFSHAVADAAIALHQRGVDPARIRSVEARLPAGTMPVVVRARRGQAPADERLRRQVQRSTTRSRAASCAAASACAS